MSAPRRGEGLLCRISLLWGHRVTVLPASPPCSLPTPFKHKQSPTHALLLPPHMHTLNLHTQTHVRTHGFCVCVCTAGKYLLIKNQWAVRGRRRCRGLKADWVMSWSKRLVDIWSIPAPLSFMSLSHIDLGVGGANLPYVMWNIMIMILTESCEG